MTDKCNSAKGKTSFDAKIDGSIIPFINRNVTPYPTEVGAPAFDLIPVAKQKDIMVNVARMYAEQEYNRIMQVVEVLQKQAGAIKRRLEITDAVHGAEYSFQVYHGQIYWLVYDQRRQKTILAHHGPHDSLVTDGYEWIARVKWLGDHSWIEVDECGNPI